MAKDPAFLFYDGDAARDVSHMNRLERGCYFDFIQAQKKFGPLTLPAIQKILGSEFETCWPSLNLILTYEKDMYYIAWLKDSIEKRAKYSESRAKNRKGSNQLENKGNGSTYVNHMENEIVIENEIEIIGNKKECSIILRTPYVNEKNKRIYDLELYFKQEGKAKEFETAGFVLYDEFMKANPANEFKDKNHLYNTFRKFHIQKQLERVSNGTSKKKLTLKDIDG